MDEDVRVGKQGASMLAVIRYQISIRVAKIDEETSSAS
jgi:hypothetical protein